MKRICALLLALVCLSTSCALAAEDYTMAEKLFKQLWAGSGFSGTLNISFETPGASTAQPIAVDVDYIYVRPTEETTAEHRIDLALMNGQTARTKAALQYKDNVLSLQADAAGTDWYTFEAETGAASAAQSAMDEGAQAALALTGLPATSRAALSLLPALFEADLLEDAIEPYKTSIDIWIEGYRQGAALDKLPDGTTTMEVNYLVSPEGVKAQLKQMVLDMLSDDRLLNLLTARLDEDTVKLMLRPSLRKWYFEVIDRIPLTGDLAISRLVSLKGETLRLYLALPLHDPIAGNASLVYERVRGEGDLPDDNTIRLTTDTSSFELVYQEYSSMTGVNVLQGTVKGTLPEKKPLAVAFTLKREESATVDAEGRQVQTTHAELTLKPDEKAEDALDFGETDIVFDARFASKELKSAATEMEMSLAMADDDDLLEVTFTGASRKKWEPAAVPEERIHVHSLSESELGALLGSTGFKLMAALADQLVIAQPEPEPTAAPIAEPSAEPETVPAS